MVTPRPGDANIASPWSPCRPRSSSTSPTSTRSAPAVQFAARRCPAGSVYGHARAFTPLLDEPLEGPVYLRSSKHDLPDMVAALRGGGIGIAIDVIGRIDSFHGGIRGSFKLPDAPVTKFAMTLNGGKQGSWSTPKPLRRAAARGARLVGQTPAGERASCRPAAQARKRTEGKTGEESR